MKIPQINQKYLYGDIYAIIQTDDGTDVSLHNKMQLCFILYMNLKYTTQKKITVCFFCPNYCSGQQWCKSLFLNKKDRWALSKWIWENVQSKTMQKS